MCNYKSSYSFAVSSFIWKPHHTTYHRGARLLATLYPQRVWLRD